MKGATTAAIVAKVAAVKVVAVKVVAAKVVAVGTGATPTQGATAPETAVIEATVMATTVAMDDATGATATIDSAETIAAEGDDEMEEALVVTGEATSARSRPRRSQSSASLLRILRPSPTSRTASAV